MSTESLDQPSGSRIRRLLDTIRGGRKNDKPLPVSTTPLPYLPAQRPRPITPTTSESQHLTATLGTLSTLPRPLRRRILTTAFGDCTLHLDLRLAHPPRTDTTYVSSGAQYEHGLGTAPLSDCLRRDHDAPKTWQWYSCVGHRMVPPGSVWERRAFARGAVTTYFYPHSDNCLGGRAICCDLWPGMCTLGVIGWLLACRQAYAEGMDVLYATNTFFIESTALLNALLWPASRTNQLLLPHRLASITSLELRWDVLLFGTLRSSIHDRHWHLKHEDRAQVAANLSQLGDTFPNIRSLVLSFGDFYNDYQVRPAQALDEIERVLLRRIADAVARLPSLEEHVVVELPSNVFGAVIGDKYDLRGVPGLALGREEKGQEWGEGRGIWLRYPLSAPSTVVCSANKRAEAEEDEELFYYIKEGVESDLYFGHDGKPRSIQIGIRSGHQHVM